MNNMNIRMIEKYYAQQRRKWALVISLTVHGIFVITIAVWLLRPLIEVIEDNIAVDIIRPIEQIQKPKKPVVKEVEQPKTRKATTTATAASFKSPAAKRLPPSMSTLPRVVEQPRFEPPPASTVAKLKPTDPILVPGVPDIDVERGSGEVVSGSGLGKREKGSGVGNRPGTGRGGGGTGKGLGKAVKGGFSGQDVFGDGTKENSGDGEGPFASLMEKLAKEIVETSGGAPIDVVFVIDNSGSMHDNIKSVIEHLKEMIGVYKASEVDYALGLTEFWATKEQNHIKVVQLTENFTEYQDTLQQIVDVSKDENALDAVIKTVKEIRFRSSSKWHFILLTDEPFTSLDGYTVDDVIMACQEFSIYVNVLGLPIGEHRRLATETGGKWHQIPEDPQPQTAQGQTAQGSIGSNVLQRYAHTPVDIVLFIDSSKSMEDKLPNFLKELDTFVRDWDNAFIDYQLAVVRFRWRESVNMINIYNPPQTVEQVRKIVRLPCEGDEALLDAVVEGVRRLKLRPNAQPHFILVTDEPAKGEYSPAAIIRMLQDKHVRVSVIGTSDDFQKQLATQTGGVWNAIPGGQKTDKPYR